MCPLRVYIFTVAAGTIIQSCHSEFQSPSFQQSITMHCLANTLSPSRALRLHYHRNRKIWKEVNNGKHVKQILTRNARARAAPLLRGPEYIDCGSLTRSSFSAVLPCSGRTWNREEKSGQVRESVRVECLCKPHGRFDCLVTRLLHVIRAWSTPLGSTTHINDGTRSVKWFFGYFVEERLRKTRKTKDYKLGKLHDMERIENAA
jgi:hypothetical protein